VCSSDLHWDQPGIHDIFRSWRTVADRYSPARAFCGEIWVGRAHRLAAYLRADELHTAFNFDFLMAPWLPDKLRAVIDATMTTHAAVGAPPTWVLGNHDVCRPVSRYARDQRESQPMDRNLSHFVGRPADFEAGLRRARAAALMMLALPGGAYIYEGEELGLPEVEDLPIEAMQDPVVKQTHGADPGRDGCRVPPPWTDDPASNFGFSGEPAAAPWLPQPADWGRYAASTQDGVPGSTLELYRAALAIRAEHPGLGEGEFIWLPTGADVLAFARGDGLECWTNFGADPVTLPSDAQVLLTSTPLTASGALPVDTTTWLQR
jgi:alpha-glucosidase